jgi:hypothetical protein
MPEHMQIHFQYEKSTKGAHRFQECDQAGVLIPKTAIAIGSLYIRKSAMLEPAPGLIVTVEVTR